MEEKKIDSKAWVRQWVAIMMGLVIAFNIAMFWFAYMVGNPMELLTFAEIMAVPVGYVGWFFKARDTEKRLKYQEALTKIQELLGEKKE